MSLSRIAVSIQGTVLDLGIKVRFFEGRSLDLTHPNGNLAAVRRACVERVIGKWSKSALLEDPVLRAYRTLHSRVGSSGRAAPESLLNFILKSGALPAINAVVDVYNSVSADTLLAIGAHDVLSLNGSVRLCIANGTERFVPLSENDPVSIQAGEYIYRDEDDVICRLEVRQCEKTKIQPSTRNALFIVQGNRETTDTHIQEAVKELKKKLEAVVGGAFVDVSPPARIL